MPNAKKLPLSDVELSFVMLGDETFVAYVPYEVISQKTA
jgi:hypothetical protein